MNRALRRRQARAAKETLRETSAPVLLKEALALMKMGQSAQAETLCQQALTLEPANLDAMNFLGVLAKERGDVNRAVAWFHRALSLKPDYTRALFNLGNLLVGQGRHAEAAECYANVLRYQPDHKMAQLKLVVALKQLRRWQEALPHAMALVEEGASVGEYWMHLADILLALSPTVIDPSLRDMAIAALADPVTPKQFVLAICVHLLLSTNAAFCELIAQVRQGNRSAFRALAEGGALPPAMEDPFLLALLPGHVVVHTDIERVLIETRAALLEAVTEEKLPAGSNDFLLVLAFQCWLNEHVYFTAPPEKERVEQLKAKLATLTPSTDPDYIARMLALACYVPLASLPNAEAIAVLAEQERSPQLCEFLKRAVGNPLEERRLAAGIPTLGISDNRVSQAVREQYEENPYPRWQIYNKVSPLPAATLMRETFPHFDTARLKISEKPEILIAGCGTGSHAFVVAGRFADATVLAVDLSLNSLAYAVRKQQEYAEKHITFLQADILKLGDLNRSFDIIECGGVLHHMEDPVAGWRILTSLLKPGGLMGVALYSELGRASIVAARQDIARMGYGDSPEEIRRFRHELMEKPDALKRCSFLRLRDFFSMSECRDLLFHRQEHRFTLPQIQGILKNLELEFIGFEISNPAWGHKYRELFPADGTMASLENWHKMEEMEPTLFANMYQFWLYKP